ncbi:DUF1120 domain-containing protein [Burkholderia ubonensis]|nr:DUF1120 domain-containing protein [Burkholderia ubonensis]
MKHTMLVRAICFGSIGSALMICGTSALAADTADLTVKGSIVPSACVPSFSGGGVVDFGTIKTVDLKQNDFSNIGRRSVKLTVSCSSKKSVAYSLTDNQKASSLGGQVASALDVASRVGGDASAYIYGLGSTEIDGKAVSLGSYALLVTSASADGAKGLTFSDSRSVDGGTWWNAGGVGFMPAPLSNGDRSYGVPYPGKFLDWHPYSLANAQQHVFDIDVVAAINKGSLLPLNQDVPLNGQATFNITYW